MSRQKKNVLQLPNGFKVDLDHVPPAWIIQWLMDQEHRRRMLEEAQRPRLHIDDGAHGPGPEMTRESSRDDDPEPR